MCQDRYVKRYDTEECNVFMEGVQPIIEPFIEKYKLEKNGRVVFQGSDPKGAGRLYNVRYSNEHFQVNIQTVDGSVDVHVGLPETSLDGSEQEWIHGRNISGNFNIFGPSGPEILELRDRLHSARVGWV